MIAISFIPRHIPQPVQSAVAVPGVSVFHRLLRNARAIPVMHDGQLPYVMWLRADLKGFMVFVTASTEGHIETAVVPWGQD